MKKYAMEFIGTFFLVLVVALTGNPLTIGAVLAVLVYAGGPISGAHYNPAVTTALLAIGKISPRELWRYVASQLLGAVAAAAVFLLLQGKFFLPSPAAHASLGIAFLVEILFTFLLVFTILRVAVDDKTKGNQYFGLAIGAALLVGATAGGPISGGAFNPAVGVMPLLLDAGHLAQHLPQIVLYIAGPLLGAVGASVVYKAKWD